MDYIAPSRLRRVTQAQTLRKCFKVLLPSFPLCFWKNTKNTNKEE